jgi:hypothetical protein
MYQQPPQQPQGGQQGRPAQGPASKRLMELMEALRAQVDMVASESHHYKALKDDLEQKRMPSINTFYALENEGN